MQLLRFIPIKLTFFLVLGIILGNYFNIGIFPSFGYALLSVAILAVVFYNAQQRKGLFLFGVIAASATVGIGILATALAQPENYATHYTHHNIEKNGVWRVTIREVMKPTAFSHRYVALVKALDNKKTSGKLLLNFAEDSTSHRLKVDDELLVYSAAETINAPLNPHQFDFRKYLIGLGISHQLQIDNNNHVLRENVNKTIFGVAAAVRNKIIENFKKTNFGEEELSIIQALLLGQRHDISEATYNDYKNAGAVHILAVSGLHIGILLLLLQFLLRPLEYLPNGKTIKLIVIVILLWAFAFLAGLSASIVRAVTMFTFVAYALYLNRPSNTFNILALSMFFILLLFNPMLLFQAGFQMSYAAVFAIVWLYPLMQKLWFPKHIIVRKIWQLLSVSVAAQLGVLPVSLYYFHQFPGLFFISNLLIVPFLGLILGAGILIILLSLTNLLSDRIAEAYNLLIKIMNDIIGWIAQQEAFVFQNIPFDRVQLILAYFIVFSLILVFSRSTLKRVMCLLAGIILFQSWTLYDTFQTNRKEIVIVAHQTRNSILLYQSGAELKVFSKTKQRTERLVTDYMVAERIAAVQYHPLKNSYIINNEKLMVIDSTGIYSQAAISPQFLLLTASPKINLDRLIDSLHPNTVIADGSNYRSYIERWKATCAKRKLPFHFTGEKGAYYFE